MATGALIHLDTHVVVWLYAFGSERLTPAARMAIGNAAELRISPMVLLELDYLHEIGRITSHSGPIFGHLRERLGLGLCDQPFEVVIRAAMKQHWTRDHFDRLITGQAASGGHPLVTKDASILANYSFALW